MCRNNSSDNRPYVQRRSFNLCVAGDTQVDIMTGGKYYKVNIDELDNILEKVDEVLVKSFDTETRLIEYKKITAFAQTNPKAKVIKITDEETGLSITCTPDHQVWTENRGYIMAKDLTKNDILQIKK